MTPNGDIAWLKPSISEAVFLVDVPRICPKSDSALRDRRRTGHPGLSLIKLDGLHRAGGTAVVVNTLIWAAFIMAQAAQPRSARLDGNCNALLYYSRCARSTSKLSKKEKELQVVWYGR